MSTQGPSHQDPQEWNPDAIASWLSRLLSFLSERERNITILLLLGFTWTELGKVYDQPREKIKRIQIEVSKKLRDKSPRLADLVVKKILTLEVRNRLGDRYFRPQVNWMKKQLEILLCRSCERCEKDFISKISGRPAKFCSGKCRQASYRARKR